MSCENEQDLKIQALELNQKSMAEKFDDLKETINVRFDKFEEMIKEIKDNKANKWVEVFLLWAGAIIGAGLLAFLGNLIYKAIIAFK